ncbi:unnamed protein product [Ilex paraguariensis]|uniref:Uncharacterized protein n=1 Tax=Ilex paraguariensis TaxID=185542 RepID=A0ABC8RHS2_9AQUA
MGKKGSNKKAVNLTSGSQSSVTLREESSGKKQTNVNVKSMLKLEHIKNIAVWASGEATIPSLGAFFGHRFAACAEALGTPPDPSLFPCQRCESILQPGDNCTVRIEKNQKRAQHRRKKPCTPTQNNVVYKCHFCSHRNIKRGTPRGHMKEIYPGKAKPPSKSEPANCTVHKPTSTETTTTGNVEVNKMDEVTLPELEVAIDGSASKTPATPSVRTGLSLLDAKMRKRNRSGSKKAAESESSPVTRDVEKASSASNKRKRKPWTSLKEIAESSDQSNNRDFTNLTVTFLI